MEERQNLKIEEKKKRQPEYEVLRVVSMLMVIVLHYLSKGGLLTSLLTGASVSDGFLWLLEFLCIGCVNVYVLISGYFMSDNHFSAVKVLKLWGQVFFYSILVATIMLVSGIEDYHKYTNLHELLYYFCPVSMGHYWFATSYIVLYLLSPVLAFAAGKLDKKQLGITVAFLLGVFCLIKTIFPFELAFDDRGIGVMWFICLFLTATYIRRFGSPIGKTKVSALFLYLFSAVMAWVCLYGASIMYSNTGKYERYLSIFLENNSIFVFGASLGLFLLFGQIKLKENAFIRFLARIAPYTFGVYLLHEHNMVNYKWPEWLRVGETYGAYRVLHLILCVLIIFCIGIIVDFIRALIFKLIAFLWGIAMKIYNAKKEVWDYLIFGVLATVVNWVAYFLTSRVYIIHLVPDNESVMALISNTIAWVVAVLFAYWTNRNFVFKSTATEKNQVIKEFVSFVSARLATFAIEEILLVVMVGLMNINDIISKIFIGIVVIVLNYVFSKLFIFKKKN